MLYLSILTFIVVTVITIVIISTINNYWHHHHIHDEEYELFGLIVDIHEATARAAETSNFVAVEKAINNAMNVLIEKCQCEISREDGKLAFVCRKQHFRHYEAYILWALINIAMFDNRVISKDEQELYDDIYYGLFDLSSLALQIVDQERYSDEEIESVGLDEFDELDYPSVNNVFSVDGMSRNGEYISDILKEYEDDLAF